MIDSLYSAKAFARITGRDIVKKHAFRWNSGEKTLKCFKLVGYQNELIMHRLYQSEYTSSSYSHGTDASQNRWLNLKFFVVWSLFSL